MLYDYVRYQMLGRCRAVVLLFSVLANDALINACGAVCICGPVPEVVGLTSYAARHAAG